MVKFADVCGNLDLVAEELLWAEESEDRWVKVDMDGAFWWGSQSAEGGGRGFGLARLKFEGVLFSSTSKYSSSIELLF